MNDSIKDWKPPIVASDDPRLKECHPCMGRHAHEAHRLLLATTRQKKAHTK